MIKSFRELLREAFDVTYNDNPIEIPNTKSFIEAMQISIADEQIRYENDEQFFRQSAQKDERDKRIAPRIGIFFGLPIDLKDYNTHPALQVIKNMTGWHNTSDPLWQKILNYTLLKPLLMLALNLAFIPFKLARNILRLGTEFLPMMLTNLFAEAYLSLTYNIGASPIYTYIPKLLGALLFGLLAVVFRMVHGIGALITSPVRTVQMQWEAGNKVTAVLSAISATILYAFLIPLTAHLLAPVIASQLSLLPPLIAKGIEIAFSTYTAVSKFLAPGMIIFGQGVNVITYGILTKVGLSMANIGLGSSMGILTLGLGSSMTVLVDAVKDWYQSFGKQPQQIERRESDKELLLEIPGGAPTNSATARLLGTLAALTQDHSNAGKSAFDAKAERTPVPPFSATNPFARPAPLADESSSEEKHSSPRPGQTGTED